MWRKMGTVCELLKMLGEHECCCVAEIRIQRTHFQKEKNKTKHASQEHLTQINMEAVADLIAATGTNVKHVPFNSGGLLSP